MSIPFAHYWVLLSTRLQSQRYRVLTLAILLLSTVGIQLLIPQVMRSFIDSIQAGASMQVLIQIALLFLSVAILKYALTLGANYASQLVGWTATNALRSDLVRHCLHLDMSFHNTHTPGELIERIDGDVSGLTNFFSELVIRALGSCLLLFGVLVALYLENWRVGAAFTLFSMLAIAIIYSMRNIATSPMQAERQASAELFGFIEERLSGTEDIRANGGTAYTMHRLFERMRTFWHHAMTAYIRIATLRTTILALFSLGTLLALILGAYLFWAGTITIGTVYLFYAYMSMIREPVEGLALETQNLQQASASILRISELTHTESLLSEPKDGTMLPAHGALGVAFQQVSFTYPKRTNGSKPDEAKQPLDTEKLLPVSFKPSHHLNGTTNGRGPENEQALDEWVLRNLSFELAPGSILGLLGRTGSGKTTIGRLLLRLYDPTKGAIHINGHDARNLPFAELRRTIGIVTQDVQLFNATVRDNLTFFDSAIEDAYIQTVIEELGLTDWYSRLPDGLDTVLDSAGAGLSAGEAQLVALTRVFLRDPGLVILDEASSRLDPATEQLIENALTRLLVGRTGIIIAHRLSTVQRADQIMILEHGEMVEFGNRQQLADEPASRFAELLRVELVAA
ncbi:MAG: ABC transporter ATP-binding protein [Chloroflexota bacterium]